MSSEGKKNGRRANGDGSLYYSEPKKRWIAQVTYEDALGNKKRKTFSDLTRNGVMLKRNQFVEENTMGSIPIDSDLTIPSVLKPLFEYEIKINRIKESTYQRKKHYLSIVENAKIGVIPISQITDSDIMCFFADITRYSNSLINKIYQIVRKAFDYACEKRIIPYNPLNSVGNFALCKPKSKKPDKKVFAYTVEEQERLLKAIKEYVPERNRNDYRCQVLIELFTGMRMGEINALTLSDIDLEAKEIRVCKTITRTLGYESKVGETAKTDAGTRTVIINEAVEPFIRWALDNYVENEQQLLFYDSKNNKVISTGQVCIWFRRLAEKNSLKYCGQHMLRHTFATRCIEAGVQAEVLSRWLGHKDISVTINTYFDAFNKLNNNAIDKLMSYNANTGLMIEPFQLQGCN